MKNNSPYEKSASTYFDQSKLVFNLLAPLQQIVGNVNSEVDLAVPKKSDTI